MTTTRQCHCPGCGASVPPYELFAEIEERLCADCHGAFHAGGLALPVPLQHAHRQTPEAHHGIRY